MPCDVVHSCHDGVYSAALLASWQLRTMVIYNPTLLCNVLYVILSTCAVEPLSPQDSLLCRISPKILLRQSPGFPPLYHLAATYAEVTSCNTKCQATVNRWFINKLQTGQSNTSGIDLQQFAHHNTLYNTTKADEVIKLSFHKCEHVSSQ